MLTPRRLFALLISSVVPLLALAQPDPAEPGLEKLSLDGAIQRALAKNFAIKVVGYDAAIAFDEIEI